MKSKWLLWVAIILLVGFVTLDEIGKHSQKPNETQNDTIPISEVPKPIIIRDSLKIIRWNKAILYVHRGDVFGEIDSWGRVMGQYYLLTDFKDGFVKFNYGSSLSWIRAGHNHGTCKMGSVRVYWLKDYSRIDHLKRFKVK